MAGLVIAATRSDPVHEGRLRAEIHVLTLLLDMAMDGLPFDVVKLDNVRATRIATEHVIGLGHRRIAVLDGLPGLVTSEDRLRGDADARGAARIAVDGSLILHGGDEQDRAFASGREAMSRPASPAALLSCSNTITLALRAAGVKVPRDLSIVGIDDLDFVDLLDPVPTVVRVPVAAMAERSILLLDALESRRPPTGKLEVFAPLLVERASCRAWTA